MFSAFQTFGKLGAIGKAIAAAWSPLALWPNGIATPGMWISPRDLTSEWQDSVGTTPVATPGTVADSSNPVGLSLDIRAGATVLTDPGNHMLQSTSAARPLLSARVNTLFATQDFSNAVWVVDEYGTGTLTKTLGQTDPNGGSTAVRLLSVTDGPSNSASFRFSDVLRTEQVIRSLYIKSNTGVGYSVNLGDTSITLVADTEFHRYDVSESAFSWGIRVSFVAIGVTDITVAFAQREMGTSLSDYQSVTDLWFDARYPSAGYPVFQLYDGVDDGMATAAFAAGTLIDGMDCLIVVRRDSAAATYLISDTGSRGFFEWESGDTNRPDVSAGTPTYYVDGVACTATRGALFTALTVGDWHILEARGLDLSTWTALEVSSLVSYRLNGARGDILLYPSTASTTDKDAARQWLADYYGVTLP